MGRASIERLVDIGVGAATAMGLALAGACGPHAPPPGRSPERQPPPAASGASSTARPANGHRPHKLAAGWRHTCALANGEVRCWGLNNAGQIGDGTMQDREAPATTLLRGVAPRALSLGHTHSCATVDGGALYCWGSNGFGELGTGAIGNAPAPTRATLFGRVGGAALGDQHTCALAEDGKVRCVGLNHLGELGDGTTVNRTTPVVVPGVEDAVEIAAGAYFTCARTRAGGVTCWGANLNGQLGDGTKTSRSRATPVHGVANAVDLVASAQAACARRDDGTAVCWGVSEVPGEPDRLEAAVVAGGARFVGIALGDRVLCGRTEGGDVTCWGMNLSRDGAGPFAAEPRSFAALRGATEIAAGGGHVCARLTDTELRCFGNAGDGQVGDGARARREPREVSALKSASPTRIASGATRTCVAPSAGPPLCWGGDVLEADGTSSPLHTPRPFAGWPPPAEPIRRLAVADGTTCALFASGRVLCSGDPGAKASGQPPRSAPVEIVARGAVDVALGSDHVCVVDAAGAVRCLGDGALGALGRGRRARETTLGAVVGAPKGITRVAASGARTCVVAAGGKVYCWGGGIFSGGLDAVAIPQPDPVEIAGVIGATALSLGFGAGCAVATGGVHCWTDPNPSPGWGRRPQVPAKVATPSATLVPGTSDAVTVATSGSHTCAAMRDGGVRCWGQDDVGQLGDGGTVAVTTPVAARGLRDVFDVSTGARHSCALSKSQGVLCWGLASDGQLGDGTSDQVLEPSRVVWR